ncbi:MAG: arsenosugar biosynthesis radical SAM protein ArsS [Arenicellaceae bacterium]|nr:arsenosugar biosynthesis radical SAM protein ArsS [Arenicellaceae bacterium]
MHDMRTRLQPSDFPAIRRKQLSTLQVNLGYTCNQTCLHCHVNAGPTRKEQMSRETIDVVLDVLRNTKVNTLDLTGGAPELNINFRYLAAEARALGVHVIDRCNLTILSEPGQGDLAKFLAEHQIEVVASLPCYLEDNVDAQRGDGVYQRSMDGLKTLNKLGYGKAESGLILNLVYNPIGPYLPPAQIQLEEDYHRELRARFGIEFNTLFIITNMPISRFGSTLVSHNQFDDYMGLLRGAMNKDNLESVMCRDIVSVDYQGYLYDCDFNQMLDIPLGGTTEKKHLRKLLEENIEGTAIAVANHCYGCTAGQGSSCGGALD